MPRPKKAAVRINCYLAQDAMTLLEQLCATNKWTYTFALEQLLRLHAPPMVKKGKS